MDSGDDLKSPDASHALFECYLSVSKNCQAVASLKKDCEELARSVEGLRARLLERDEAILERVRIKAAQQKIELEAHFERELQRRISAFGSKNGRKSHKEDYATKERVFAW